MFLGVCKGWDASLVYGGKIDKNMCIPHVHPSFCLGVLCMWVFGALSRRRGGAIADSLYHWRRVVWILLIACGGCRLRGS